MIFHTTKLVPGKWYDIPKNTMKTCFIDPFEPPVKGKNIPVTILATPIIAFDKFHGVVGVDVRLDFI